MQQAYAQEGWAALLKLEGDIITYELTPEQKKKWETTVKIGILKQLYADKLLTDTQLNQLIYNIKKQ